MSEQKPCSLDEQKKNRPKIEDVIPQYLAGDKIKSALDFIAYLRTNKMSPGWAGFTNAWKATNKGRTICYIKLGAGSGASNIKNNKWVVTPFLENLSKYEASLARYSVHHILQVPHEVDNLPASPQNWEPLIFASTGGKGVYVIKNGLWNAQD